MEEAQTKRLAIIITQKDHCADWDSMRHSIEKIHALGEPREKFLSKVSFQEIELMEDVQQPMKGFRKKYK